MNKRCISWKQWEREREGQKSLKDLKHSLSREDRRERPDPEVMGLMEFREAMKGGSATFEAGEVKCRGRTRKERERRLDQSDHKKAGCDQVSWNRAECGGDTGRGE